MVTRLAVFGIVKLHWNVDRSIERELTRIEPNLE